jgi:hypothetical protein
MNGYILFIEGKGYLRDPDAETITKDQAQAYVFYHRDEAEDTAENWYGADVISVYREES